MKHDGISKQSGRAGGSTKKKKKKKKSNLQKYNTSKKESPPYEEKINPKYEFFLRVMVVALLIAFLVLLLTRVAPGYDAWPGMPRNWIR